MNAASKDSQLNALGYGDPEGDLCLDLVYNPAGANLPPAQAQLEQHYRGALLNDHGLRFNHLLTITNMAIERFAKDLERQGQLESYQQLLRDAFRNENVTAVMCRSLISVNWLGQLFDCDFNQQLGLGCPGSVTTLQDLLQVTPDGLAGQTIAIGEHCFGCTAGNGSSCSGALN